MFLCCWGFSTVTESTPDTPDSPLLAVKCSIHVWTACPGRVTQAVTCLGSEAQDPVELYDDARLALFVAEGLVADPGAVAQPLELEPAHFALSPLIVELSSLFDFTGHTCEHRTPVSHCTNGSFGAAERIGCFLPCHHYLF